MPAGRYSAETPSLFDNPGGPLAPRYNVDIPGAINALANGTSSVIHGIYARKMAQRQQDIEQQRYNQQAGWHADEVARQRERDQIDQQRWAAQHHLDQLKAGVTPASEGGMTVTATPAPDASAAPAAPAGPPSPLDPSVDHISAGLQAGLGGQAPAPAAPSGADLLGVQPDGALGQAPTGRIASALKSSSLTGQAPAQAPLTAAPVPALGGLPTLSYGREDATPESYDATKSEAYQQHMATVEAMGGSRERVAQTNAGARRDVAASNLEGRKVMAAAAKYAADKRATTKGKGITGALTGNALEAKFERVDAPGLLAANGYDLPKAIDVLQTTPEGQALAAQGFSARHLAAAYEKHIAGQTGQATRLQSGALGLTPEEATGAVAKTDKLVRGAAPATPAPAPASGAPAPAKQLSPKPAADAEPTDDELRAAMKDGIKPGDAKGARAWVAKQRKAKQPTTGAK